MLKPSLPLTIKNISALYREFTALINQGLDITFDLSEVTEVDSSGIALIIELKQYAKSKKRNFITHSPSPLVLRLCNLYKINF